MAAPFMVVPFMHIRFMASLLRGASAALMIPSRNRHRSSG
jgi:hypothetical protein